MQVSLNQAQELVTTYLKHNIVPYIKGSPAIGKSSIVQAIAKKFGLKLIDIRLAECDPTELSGFPVIENGRSSYAPMQCFPIQGDTIPEGCNGWLIFLDEFSNAPPAVQNVAYKLVLDRQVGQHKLHENAFIVAAGNLETDGANVEQISSALISRMAVFETAVDSEEWAEFAASQNIDHRIIGLVNWRPNFLYTFNPDSAEDVYASPRTWFAVNRIIKDQVLTDDHVRLLAPLISEGVAREFIAFSEIYRDLPSIAEICKNPNGIKVPDRLDIRWATLTSVASHATEDNIADLCVYIDRFPGELRVVCIKQMVKRDPTLMKTKAINDWFVKNAQELL